MPIDNFVKSVIFANMKLPLYLLGILLMISCGTSTVVDYDPETDFKSYTTYGSYPILDSGLSDLDDKRIIQLCDSIMQSKGFIQSKRPDLHINFYASEFLDMNRSTIGIGVGGGGRNGGIGVSGGVPVGSQKIEQKLTFDIIDVKMDKLIWQGVVNKKYPLKATAKQMDAHYQTAVWAIFSKFPPDAQ